MAEKLRGRIYEIIFESDTAAGKLFDIILIWSILLSVLAVCIDSVKSIRMVHGELLYIVEWLFTILFTLEYLLRIVSIRRPTSYMVSFYGIVDLLAILPTYFSILLPGSQYFLVIRILRVLRIFRILKFVQYIREAKQLMLALRAARKKITVFLFTVFTMVVIIGALMYLIEGEEHGFTSIPRSIYWAIVTLTTVGYGDISPQTGIGQAIASLVMIMGYGIIAVPTGIMTVEMSRAERKEVSGQVCGQCGREGHDTDAVHCKFCGTKL